MNNGFHTEVIYINYAKALEIVCHERPFRILQAYTATRSLLEWSLRTLIPCNVVRKESFEPVLFVTCIGDVCDGSPNICKPLGESFGVLSYSSTGFNLLLDSNTACPKQAVGCFTRHVLSDTYCSTS